MRIIAVDDERLALEALVSSIVKAVPDAAVHGFRDPAEAMDFLRSHICDVAFLDIRMRGISGLELARRIKELHGSTNIVFVTGYSEYALDAFRVYASDYLLKPPTPAPWHRHCNNCARPSCQSPSTASASSASGISTSLPTARH